MKIKLDEIDSKIVKENSTYTVVDNTYLNNLVVSKTILHPTQETTGHKHDGQEEVYQFVNGHGLMDVGERHGIVVNSGDTVLIPDGDFHRVYNTSKHEDLIFVCVFNGKREALGAEHLSVNRKWEWRYEEQLSLIRTLEDNAVKLRKEIRDLKKETKSE